LAGFAGIAAAGRSIEMLLNSCFEDLQPLDPPPPEPPGNKTKAVLVRTSDFEAANIATRIGTPALSIFLYRVDFNKVMRAAWSATSERDGRAHLALDLHYLITPWGENAEDEHRILGRAMQCMESTPILTGPLLHSSGEWDAGESIQVVLEEVSSEAVMRMFDSLPTDYRLSVPYIARVMRLDSRIPAPEGPVITAITGLTPTTRL
jgi:Pvc16 N-terminal domain